MRIERPLRDSLGRCLWGSAARIRLGCSRSRSRCRRGSQVWGECDRAGRTVVRARRVGDDAGVVAACAGCWLRGVLRRLPPECLYHLHSGVAGNDEVAVRATFDLARARDPFGEVVEAERWRGDGCKDQNRYEYHDPDPWGAAHERAVPPRGRRNATTSTGSSACTAARASSTTTGGTTTRAASATCATPSTASGRWTNRDRTGCDLSEWTVQVRDHYVERAVGYEAVGADELDLCVPAGVECGDTCSVVVEVGNWRTAVDAQDIVFVPNHRIRRGDLKRGDETLVNARGAWTYRKMECHDLSSIHTEKQRFPVPNLGKQGFRQPIQD